jgi:hypothetical protein
MSRRELELGANAFLAGPTRINDVRAAAKDLLERS